jgi:hypothetical protein
MKATEVIQKMLEARDTTHLIHWQTASYAEHKALGKFYDGWLDLVDTFVETYQGIYGRVNANVSISASAQTDATEYLYQLKAYIQIDAPEIIVVGLDKDLDNILADMLGLINHTLYLLTLK